MKSVILNLMMIFILNVSLISCAKYYYKPSPLPQKKYSDFLKGRNITLIGFYEIQSKSGTSRGLSFSSSGKVKNTSSRSYTYYAADGKSRLGFGTAIHKSSDGDGLNPSGDKEGISHFLKRYSEAEPKIKKKLKNELEILFNSTEFDFDRTVRNMEVSLKENDTDYYLFGNLKEESPEVKVQVFYIIPYIFICAFSLFTIPLIADVSDNRPRYHLYDRNMKLLHTFSSDTDIIEVSAWWARFLPKFKGECAEKSSNPEDDLCPDGLNGIKLFSLKEKLYEYLNQKKTDSSQIPDKKEIRESEVLILKNGKKVRGNVRQNGEYYTVVTENGETFNFHSSEVEAFDF